ncbi:hypothetical protein DFR50_11977 [Roseiarcus fermentans]|uniref:Uncharacterized protein n=1 Tax=Roseiarcus fermentans TaxID=1473586 RepID=A0A366F8H0_9HYPH|nr:hypothetical protein DFR50_11977 [Roseiarcus fermentans]
MPWFAVTESDGPKAQSLEKCGVSIRPEAFHGWLWLGG